MKLFARSLLLRLYSPSLPYLAYALRNQSGADMTIIIKNKPQS